MFSTGFSSIPSHSCVQLFARTTDLPPSSPSPTHHEGIDRSPHISDHHHQPSHTPLRGASDDGDSDSKEDDFAENVTLKATEIDQPNRETLSQTHHDDSDGKRNDRTMSRTELLQLAKFLPADRQSAFIEALDANGTETIPLISGAEIAHLYHALPVDSQSAFENALPYTILTMLYEWLAQH